LVLIYSGIDTLGLLAAAPEIDDATGETFKGWCKKYLLARLQSIDGKPLEAVLIFGRPAVAYCIRPLRFPHLAAKEKRTKSGIGFKGR